MKHYTKFSLDQPDALSVPELRVQILDVPCYHCGSTTRFPIPPSYVDWEPVATLYKEQLEKTMRRFHQIVTDIDVMHAGPNPVREYLDNEMKMLLLEIKRKFGDDLIT